MKFLRLCLLILILSSSTLGATPLPIFVSILPQKTLVERIGGDHVEVSVLVGPGQSPATYSPTPQQMSRLGEAKLYLKIGAPFEKVWLGRIASNHADLRFVDCAQGIKLKPMVSHDHSHDKHHGNSADALDPHIWTDPIRLIKVAENMRDALIKDLPNSKNEITQNCDRLTKDLIALDRRITDRLAGYAGRGFLASHPSWSYFADRYHLQQYPIEIAGREPSARQTAQLVNLAREKNIRAVLVQQQFSRRSAEAMSQSIGAIIITADPLGGDILSNLYGVADRLANTLGGP